MREILGWRLRRTPVFPAASLLRLGLALCLSLAALTNAAQAERPSNDDTAATTMQVFVAIANLAGAPIPKEAVPVMQGMVSCALAGTSLPDCVKNIAISTALSEIAKSGGADPAVAGIVSEAVHCLTGGNAAQVCLTNAAVKQLPPEAQPLASCIGGGGNLGTCAERAALTVATQQLGANLPPEVASTVQCVIGGGNLASCASSLVTNEVNQALKAANAPPEVTQAVNGMVNCVNGGGNAGDCAKSVAIDSIPAGPAKDMASCLKAPGANAQTCVANLAAKNISDPTASAVVGCMGQSSGDQVQKCIASHAKEALGDAASQAAQQALVAAANTIANLQLDQPIQAPPKFPEQPAILQNILSVANGIQQGNWLLVVKGVGPEAAEVAGKIILSVFLTPALASVLSPVVDSMIQNDVNAFTNAVTDLGKGDAVGVAQDIFKWYETQYIQAPCALMPDGGFRNSVCNGLATAINWVANAGGDLAKDILGVGKDILKAIGLWDPVDDVATTLWKGLTSAIDDVGHFLGIGRNETKVVCVGFPSPSDYFANHVLSSCLSSATANAAASTPASMRQSDVSAVVGQCTSLYNLCATTEEAKQAVQANCGKMGSALGQMASSTAGGLRQAASRYAQTGIAIFAAKKYAEYKKKGNAEDICSTGFWSANLGEFAAGCAAAVGAPLQMPSGPYACPIRPTYDAVTQACITTLNNSSYLTNAVAGPNSALCKKFEQDALKNPCQFTTKTSIVLPSGQVIATHLECSYIKPPWNRSGVLTSVLLPPKLLLPRLPLPLNGSRVRGVFASIPGSDLIHVLPSPPKSGGVSNGRPGQAALKFPDVGGNRGSATPKVPTGKNPSGSGGSGGIGGRPNMHPPIVPPRGRNPGEGQVAKGGGGPGTGGANTSRRGNSAMDVLGDLNTGGAMSGAAGAGSGGISGGRPRPGRLPPVAGVPTRPRLPVGGLPGAQAKAPSGSNTGTGGVSMVNGQSGNAPVSRRTSTSGNFRPVTKLKVKPSKFDPPIDYGGCSGCGQQRRNDLDVR